MPKSASSGQLRPSFFERFLTTRHFLTPRAIAGLVVAVGAIAGTAIYLQAYGIGGEEKAGDTAGPVAGEGDTQVRLLNVEVTPVTRRPPAELVQTYTGTVQPRRASILAAKVGGRLESIVVDTGDEVKAGQRLASLDEVQVKAQIDASQAALAAAEARLDELVQGPRTQDIQSAISRVEEIKASLSLRVASFGRTERLFQSGSVSQQEFDEAKFSLDAIRAQLAAAQQELDKLQEGSRSEKIAASRATVSSLSAQLRVLQADLRERQILAPFNGRIQSRFIDEGTIVAPGQQILQIVESAPYEIRAALPASEVNCFDDVNIEVHHGENRLEAKLARIAPALNEATQTREVILDLNEESSQQVPLGGAVTIQSRHVRQSQGFWVPTSALTEGSRGLWAIYVAAPDAAESPEGQSSLHTIERRQVERVLQAGELWSEVQGPISEGDLIVASGAHRIVPGQRVRCVVADQ